MEGKHMMPNGHMMSDKEMVKKKKKMMKRGSYNHEDVAMARKMMA